MKESKYATVVVPLALPQPYIYEIPIDLESTIEVGLRVEVAIKNKLYSGLVIEVNSNLKLSYKTKPIIAVLDELPIITFAQIKFWRWIAEYYCCTLGEVMHAAVPASLKLQSETKVIFNDKSNILDEELTDDEYLVSEAVSIQNELTIANIQDILSKKSVYPIIRSLLDKKIISVKEELQQKFTYKKAKFAILDTELLADSFALNNAFAQIAKSEKQTRALLAAVQMSQKGKNAILVKDICQLANVDTAVINSLAKKGFLVINEQEVSRIFHNENQEFSPLNNSVLTVSQIEALRLIYNYFEVQKPVLLHGVTGSGKTKVYAELMKKYIEDGKQVLYLMPEIALTQNMVTRLKKIFGPDIMIYHSRLNNNERVEIWHAVLNRAKIIIAARSGLFLPFHNLGLVIVDEEHDASYKQQDPNPRYNARDAAVFLAMSSQANIILGSATPSLETYTNSLNNKYGLVEMSERYGEASLPNIHIVDLRKEYRDQRFDGIFSQFLKENIQMALEKKEQVLLFQNRRGYAPVIGCQICGWHAFCANCDVKMTYHKVFDELRCHYCGSRTKKPQKCPACGNEQLVQQGFGTEKIEEEISRVFPQARIARIDMDTAKTKIAFESIMHEFEEGRVDILVGTQMITKGLDFSNLSIVGVLIADRLFQYPDLRANERAFQLMTQVAGRAGRHNTHGNVVIQTFHPEHPTLSYILNGDYKGFYHAESKERNTFHYPPNYRLIHIELLHKKFETVFKAAELYKQNLSKKLGNRVLGPATPSIGRVRNQYIQTIIIKIENKIHASSKVKAILLEEKAKMQEIKYWQSVKFVIDVDPY